VVTAILNLTGAVHAFGYRLMKNIMNKFELLIASLATYASALYRFIGSLTVSIILSIPILVLFGDTLLSLLGHGLAALGHSLHLLFEVFESITGHILEEAFHLDKRTAEIIFFWSSLGGAIGLSWYLSRKAHIAALRAVTTARERRIEMDELSKIIAGIRIALIISSLSATLYFLPNAIRIYTTDINVILAAGLCTTDFSSKLIFTT
jgi:hypothetical protein